MFSFLSSIFLLSLLIPIYAKNMTKIFESKFKRSFVEDILHISVILLTFIEHRKNKSAMKKI